MTKQINEFMQQEYTKRFEDVNDLMVVSVRGVSGTDNNTLRGELLKKDIRVTVVKNSLAKRILESKGLDNIGDVLSGPCAIAYGGADIVDLAKALVDTEKEYEKFEIKGGYLDGSPLDQAAAKAVAKMPSRVELQGMVVQLATSPGSRLVSAATSPAGNIAGILKAIIEKGDAA